LVAAQPEARLHLSIVVIVIETRVQKLPRPGKIKPVKSHNSVPSLHKKARRVKLTNSSARITVNESRRNNAAARM
jgi:hypothetical protein